MLRTLTSDSEGEANWVTWPVPGPRYDPTASLLLDQAHRIPVGLNKPTQTVRVNLHMVDHAEGMVLRHLWELHGFITKICHLEIKSVACQSSNPHKSTQRESNGSTINKIQHIDRQQTPQIYKMDQTASDFHPAPPNKKKGSLSFWMFLWYSKIIWPKSTETKKTYPIG